MWMNVYEYAYVYAAELNEKKFLFHENQAQHVDALRGVCSAVNLMLMLMLMKRKRKSEVTDHVPRTRIKLRLDIAVSALFLTANYKVLIHDFLDKFL